MRDDGGQIETALHHIAHLVPVVHLAPVDALQGQSLADDIVHVHFHGLVAETEERYLSAVTHDGKHLVERSTVSAHFQTHVKAFHQALFAHHVVQILFCRVDGGIHVHFACQVQTVFVHVGNDNASGTRKFADTRRNDADRPGTRDQHVFADQIPHQRRVRGIPDRIEKGDHVLREFFVNDDDVCLGYADVFGKSAVPVNAHAAGVFTPLDIAGMAVAAVVTGDMSFARDTLPDMKARDTGAERGDFADVFVPDRHRRLDVERSPRIPVVNMYIGAADRGFMDPDQHLSRTRFRHLYTAQLQSFSGGGFYDCIHHLFHRITSCQYFTRKKAAKTSVPW